MTRRALWTCSFLLLASAGGCATRTPARVGASDPPDDVSAEREYEAVAASALVFDPPVAAGQPPLELSRAPRRASAFLGYDEGVAEYFYLRWDDRQSSDGYYDRYERRAISEKVGVRYR